MRDQSTSHIAESEQEILKQSRDDRFKVLAFEVLGYDPINNTVNRVTMRAFGDMGVDDIDTPSDSVTYIGTEDIDGTYCIQKKEVTGTATSMRYATIKNNPLVTTYADAWSSRLTLTYNLYSIAF